MGIDAGENGSCGSTDRDTTTAADYCASAFLFFIICFFLFLVLVFVVPAAIANESSCNPSVYIQELYVPSLTETTTLNTSIFIDLQFKRAAASFAVATYADLNMNVYYGVDPSFPVANHTVPRFRMGDKKRVHYRAAVEAPPLPWEVSGGSTVALVVVELLGEFKAKDCGDDSFGRYCNWSEVKVHSEVWVDGSGVKVSKKPIKFA